jgi:hypothetical protein
VSGSVLAQFQVRSQKAINLLWSRGHGDIGDVARRRRGGERSVAILAHLGWSEPDEEVFAQETRIILAAADFGKEITTAVLWLRDRYGVDIRCMRLRPHRMTDGRLLLDIQPLIPLPEAAEFQTQLGAKQAAERKERAERHELRYRFWAGLLEAARPCTKLHATRSPSDAISLPDCSFPSIASIKGKASATAQ